MINIRTLISEIVAQVISENFQRGEWWITDDGSTIYCDIDIGDQGHQGIIIEHCAREILSHFGIDVDEAGLLGEYEDCIKQVLLDDERLSEEELEEWNMKSPSEIILRKLIEDKVYPSDKQANEALYISYGGTSSRDPRDYGMEYLKWKIMKTFGNRLEIQTWTLTSGDLDVIIRGIWDIEEETFDDEDNKTNINLTVVASGRVYHDIPLEVLEKKLPAEVIGYRKDKAWMTEIVNEDYHYTHKDYRLYEGKHHIVAIFEDNSRLQFEVHFRDKHGPDKDKWIKKAASKWKSLASKIHNDVQLTEQGNPIEISWKTAFTEALKDPELKEFIRDNPHQQIFRNT